MKARIAFESATRGQIPLSFFSALNRASHSSIRAIRLLVPFAEDWDIRVAGADGSVLSENHLSDIDAAPRASRRRDCARAAQSAALAAVAAMGTLPALTVIPGAI